MYSILDKYTNPHTCMKMAEAPEASPCKKLCVCGTDLSMLSEYHTKKHLSGSKHKQLTARNLEPPAWCTPFLLSQTMHRMPIASTSYPTPLLTYLPVAYASLSLKCIVEMSRKGERDDEVAACPGLVFRLLQSCPCNYLQVPSVTVEPGHLNLALL